MADGTISTYLFVCRMMCSSFHMPWAIILNILFFFLAGSSWEACYGRRIYVDEIQINMMTVKRLAAEVLSLSLSISRASLEISVSDRWTCRLCNFQEDKSCVK